MDFADFEAKYGNKIIAAQHMDALDRLPRWQRWGHWLLASWRCPACKEWKRKR